MKANNLQITNLQNTSQIAQPNIRKARQMKMTKTDDLSANAEFLSRLKTKGFTATGAETVFKSIVFSPLGTPHAHALLRTDPT